jgi:hypothetical protein
MATQFPEFENPHHLAPVLLLATNATINNPFSGKQVWLLL